MLPAAQRLRRSEDFARSVRLGIKAGSAPIVGHLWTPLSPGADPGQVGLVVSRAVGCAVVRNRVKRRLRAILAPLVPQLPLDALVVVRALPAAGDASFIELQRATTSVVGRLVRRSGG